MELADRLGNPSMASMARFAMGGALMERDPERARQLLLESIELGREVGNHFFVGIALGRVARMAGDASDPVWAGQFRDVIEIAVEHGDRRNANVLLDVHAQALVTVGRSEPAGMLFGYVQQHARHVENPYSKLSAERVVSDLTAVLGTERFDALRARGAALDFDDAVALSLAELDRVIEGIASDP
jgi:hypothetical protein